MRPPAFKRGDRGAGLHIAPARGDLRLMLFVGLLGEDGGSNPSLCSNPEYPGSLERENEGDRVPEETLAGRARLPWRTATLSSRHRSASALLRAPTSFSGNATTTRSLEIAVISTVSPLLWWVAWTEINATWIIDSIMPRRVLSGSCIGRNWTQFVWRV